MAAKLCAMSSVPAAVRPSRSSPRAPERAAPHVTLGHVPVFDGDLEASLNLILGAIAAGEGLRVATANLDFLALARRDAHLRADLETSHLVVADGAPVAWMARAAGARRVRRVAGVDLVEALVRRAPSGTRLAIYGSTEELTARAVLRLEEGTRGARFVARVSPPFRPLEADEEAALLAPILAAEPHVVFVALGCPRQERFIARHFARLPGAAWVGVGGTFDFFGGRRRRAPKVAQAAGMEWAVRLAQEPGRLWRRYLLRDVPELVRLVPSVVGGRKPRVLP